jgi:hypothetical protein
MTYDSADGYILQFGGKNLTAQGNLTPELGTWTFQAGKWAELPAFGAPPSPRVAVSLAYDPSLGETVLFGGQSGPSLVNNANDTWYFVGGNWTNVSAQLSTSPVPAYQGYMVYDQADGYLLYLGLGYEGANETWLFGNPPPLARTQANPGVSEANETYTLDTTVAGGTGVLH